MIAARVVPKGELVSKVKITYSDNKKLVSQEQKKTLVLKPYNKKELLQVLCLYSKWHFRQETQQLLFRARAVFGTQFLLDLFILTEQYMNHWPTFAMHNVRKEIVHVLNQCPNFRLLYEI